MQFELPAVEERYRMLTYYMSKYLLKAGEGNKAATIVVDRVEEKHIREAADVTEGFSGESRRYAWWWQRKPMCMRSIFIFSTLAP